MNINKILLSAQNFYKNNDLKNAKKLCETILKSNKNHLSTIDLLVDINIKYENFKEALRLINKAIELNNKNYLIYFKKSFILFRINNYDQALQNLNQAINLNPAYKEAYNFKAIILSNMNKVNNAIENWTKAINIDNDYAEGYFNLANFYNLRNNFKLSLENYNKALQVNNKYFSALVNRADLYLKYEMYKLALTDYNNLIKTNPNIQSFHYNKAICLDFLNNKKDAILSLNVCINIDPQFAPSFFLRSMIFRKQKKYKEALFDLEKAYSLNKESYFLSSLIILKSILCDWDNIENYQNELINSLKNTEKVTSPIFIQHFFDSPELEKKAANAYNKNFKIIDRKKINYKNKKIRLGYYSADFRNHATTHLIARLFELHDKNNFEIFAFSFCPRNEKDLTQKRIINSCNKFIDVHKKTDWEIIQISKEFKIDIALDLMGFVNNNRYNIFTKGCAPIQINYLGYPGTCGPNVMDYIIGDNTLITKKNENFFSEKIIFLPDTYQPNDDKKIISKKKITKKDFNLPEDKFIFCSFNRSYKITSKMFNIWIDILKNKKNSILWLFADNNLTKINLKKEFTKLGLDPKLLVFADPVNHSEHLARHSMADLFMDTFPYTGHTTVSDALWTGLPLVTKMGNSFASRVSASLLNALNVGELITKTDEEYKKLIIDLSNNQHKLLKIKDKIISNISTEPLFNSKLYTKNIEKAYKTTYENYFKNKKINIKI